MELKDSLNKNFDHIMAEINYEINLLYVTPCVYTRNLVLNNLRDRIYMLESLIKAINQQVQLQQIQNKPGVPDLEELPQPLQITLPGNQKTFTLQELSRFDGKNGNPAYVAVNGIVYDITNNAAWAAATHFGLKAGMELTNEFASCHAGQSILNKLKEVGKLV